MRMTLTEVRKFEAEIAAVGNALDNAEPDSPAELRLRWHFEVLLRMADEIDIAEPGRDGSATFEAANRWPSLGSPVVAGAIRPFRL